MQNKKKIPKKKYLTVPEFRKETGVSHFFVRNLIAKRELEFEKTAAGPLRITREEAERIKQFIRHPLSRIKLFLRILGPGVITGASDDDPGGVGTYSAVGARFGYGMLWMALWLLPVMVAVQEICARIGIVTNKGLTSALCKKFNKKIVFGIVFLLIVANVVNIGADLSAMADALNMITGIDWMVGAASFAMFIIFLEIFFRYHFYVRILKWLTLSVFSYVLAGFLVGVNWLEVIKYIAVPRLEFSREYLFGIIAVFGTTITPYLFFWQTSEEVEEESLLLKKYRFLSKTNLNKRISRMRQDVSAGMTLANIVFFFVVLTTAQVLHRNGIFNIDSPQQAAMALRPLAGEWAYLLFSLGIIGTGLLAIPVLAGSGAYALCELLRWKQGLELKFSRARGFYLIIAFSIIIGLILNATNVNSLKALYYSAFLNGVIAFPILFAIMILGDSPKIVGSETHPMWVRFFGWISVFFVGISILAMIIFMF